MGLILKRKSINIPKSYACWHPVQKISLYFRHPSFFFRFPWITKLKNMVFFCVYSAWFSTTMCSTRLWTRPASSWIWAVPSTSGKGTSTIFGRSYSTPGEYSTKSTSRSHWIRRLQSCKLIVVINLNIKMSSITLIFLPNVNTLHFFLRSRFEKNTDAFKTRVSECVADWRGRLYEAPPTEDPHYITFSPYEMETHEPVRKAMVQNSGREVKRKVRQDNFPPRF